MPTTNSYKVIYRVTPHVQGTPFPGVDFRGICVPGWIHTIEARYQKKNSSKPEELILELVGKKITDLTFDELAVHMHAYAKKFVKSKDVRLTKRMGGSINPNGGPPWIITRRGGYIELEFREQKPGGGGEMVTCQIYPFGVTLKYALEIEFVE